MKWTRVLGIGLVLALLVTAIPSAWSKISEAAGNGTLSPTNSTITYSAGPFLVPNVTGATGAVTCNSVTPCDEFSLMLAVPGGYEATHNVTIRTAWDNTLADFDLYVLDAGGNEVANSASSFDPEVLVIPALAGNYTVRVVPYAPLGQSFTTNLSI